MKMKHQIINGLSFLLLCLTLLGLTACKKVEKQSVKGVSYDTISIDAPFDIQVSKVVFPERVFLITDFGAKTDALFDNSTAINSAIAKASESGGGKVIVPSGVWFTKGLRLQSNVNLHLQEGAVLSFSDNREDYLPVVFTRWEGIECMNYSPLIYARGCENIAIIGKGELRGNGKKWYSSANKRLLSLTPLYDMVMDGVAPDKRMMTVTDSLSHLRPSFLQLIDCKNILLSDYTITSGPMWTNHLIYCKNIVVQNLKVHTAGHNTDGLVLDSSEDILIDGCEFSTGDDCIVIKSGLNEDGWRVNRPTRNLVARNILTHKGHGGVVIGSEMSGGIENILAYDCVFKGTGRGLRIKSMRGRGAYVKNVYFKNITMDSIKNEAIKINMRYGSSSIKPRGDKTPVFGNIVIDNVKTKHARYALVMHGLSNQPIEGIEIKNFECESAKYGIDMDSCSGIHLENIEINAYETEVKAFDGNQEVKLQNLTLNGKAITEL